MFIHFAEHYSVVRWPLYTHNNLSKRVLPIDHMDFFSCQQARLLNLSSIHRVAEKCKVVNHFA